jgi:hypothetical protein
MIEMKTGSPSHPRLLHQIVDVPDGSQRFDFVRTETACQGVDKDQLRSVLAHISILGFDRNHGAFDDAILTSPPAIRATNVGMSIKPRWAKGAKILVPGLDPQDIEQLYGRLFPHHVVAFEEDTREILGTLSRMPPHERPRLEPSKVALQIRLYKEFQGTTNECMNVAMSSSEPEAPRWKWFKFRANTSG